MAYNKIIYGGKTLLDLTGDTVTADKLLSGFTAHDKSGESIEGSCTFDADTSDATVAVAEMLATKTAYARGVKLTGTMKNNGKVNGTITTRDQVYTVPQGYHDGSGTVAISNSEKSKIIPSNIREGVTILGIVGEMSGSEEENAEESKTVTPSSVQQTITPSDSFTCMRQVVVEPIPYQESENAAGGITVTIG